MFKYYLYFLNYTFFPFIFYWVYTATIVAFKVSAYKTTTKAYIYELKPKHDSHDKHAISNLKTQKNIFVVHPIHSAYTYQ